MSLYAVTVKLLKNPKHDPRNKQEGRCPVNGGLCSDVTGEHHTILVEAPWTAARSGPVLPPDAIAKKQWRIITRDGRGDDAPWSIPTEDEDTADFELGLAEGEGNWPGLAKQSRWTAETQWKDEEKSDG